MTNSIHLRRQNRRAQTLLSASQAVESLERRILFSRLVGLDVSTYQPNVNWASVHSAGKNFAIIRATAGLNTNDDQFANNTNPSTGAQARGLYSGFYHYAYYDLSGHTAVGEADHFWNIVKSKMVANGKTLMPMLDIEEGLPSGWTPQQLVNWINGWCNEVKSKAAAVGLNVTPMIYMNASSAANSGLINSDVAVHWPLVVAQWPGGTVNTQSGEPSGTGFWQDWAFWQYADNGHVSGVGNGTTTNVDMDVFHGDSKIISDFIIGGQGTWADGTWLRVNASSGLKAWSDPTSATVAPYSDNYSVIPNGTYGKVLQGPVYGNGFMRWQIQYSNGVTGWSAEPFLISVVPGAAGSPNPGNNAKLQSLPSFFTWTGNHASSYKVYLDGVLKANATSASWAHIPIVDGTHTWRIDSINDGIVTTGTTWQFTQDGTPPTASYGGQTPVTGTSTFDFTVTYNDAVSGLDGSSVGAGDVTVTGPNSFSASASFISLNGNTATYRIAAPDGVWDLADDGSYTVSQNATQVKDIVGNWRSAGTIGTFNVSAAFAYLDGQTLHVDYAPAISAVSLGNDGAGNLTATENGQTLSFADGSITGILVDSDTDSDHQVTVAATLGKPLALQSNVQTNNVIELQSGVSQTFASDAGASASNLTIVVDAGASAVFSASQHLAGLTVNGSASVSGAGLTLVTHSLAISGALDLGANNMVIEGGVLGTWTGSGYDGITGLAAAGYAGTNGLYSSATDSTRQLAIAQAPDALGLAGSQTAIWEGQTVDTSSILVKYTYRGDANLDGKVNIDDYGRIDGNVGQSGVVFGWYNGDFNLDGRINIDDYGIIDGVIGIQGPPIL